MRTHMRACTHARTHASTPRAPSRAGAASFYAEFLEAFVARAERGAPAGWRCSAVVVGHPGHSTHTLLPRPLSLDEQVCVCARSFFGRRGGGGATPRCPSQVRHKVAALVWLQERLPAAGIILGGHSVGAYMCMRVMDALSAPAAVLQVHNWFPTVIDLGATPNAGRLAPLFTRAGRRGAMAVAWVVRTLLPFPAQRWLVRLYMPGAPAWVPDVVRSLLHEDVANAALTMGAQEMVEIAAQVLSLNTDVWEHRVRWLFAHGDDDGWVPALVRDRLGARFDKSVSSVCAPHARVPHAFCVSHSTQVADVAWAWAAEALQDAGAR